MTQDDHKQHGKHQELQAAPIKLSAEAVKAGMPTGWQGDDQSIWRDFSFEHYLDGVRFAERVGQQAQQANHHPDVLISYLKVRVTYSTHDAGGVTALDLSEAASIIELK
ncbi:4a-hydroxytetrahydrobiopterin dehydratase [Deinococcus sp.]|uniref:4a-hydroxytetrahydrobiopterin dehydratase n=1 Tax=Deinococcus sp. TaxID=47478 RepID=UPI003CC541AC